MIETFFLLCAAHALCDYPLQGDWLSEAKNPMLRPFLDEAIWPGALASHALIHAAAVYLILHNPIAAGCEFIAHFVIDWMKCKGYFGYNFDQGLHVTCKVVWIIFIGALT